MNPSPEPRARRRPTRYSRHWAALALMPPLCHWPDRPQPYTDARSQVLARIRWRCGVDFATAFHIFESARRKGVIRFDPETRLWNGKDWRP